MIGLASRQNTYCLDFDGTNDYLIHNTSNFRGSDDRGTIFAWLYFDSVSGGRVIFGKADTADTGEYWILQSASDGNIWIDDKADGTSNEVRTTADVLSINQWHSVAVVSTGSAYSFYLNGSAITDITGTNDGGWINGMTDSDNITLGALKYNSVVSEFDGKIMQVAYFGGSVADQGVLLSLIHISEPTRPY